MEFAIQNSKFENLKSNMDRFIVGCISSFAAEAGHLKSNMDRFIASSAVIAAKTQTNLKSNMDRFIELINRRLNFISII